MVSIAAFQAVDPGSIPGHRIREKLTVHFSASVEAVDGDFVFIIGGFWGGPIK